MNRDGIGRVELLTNALGKRTRKGEIPRVKTKKAYPDIR